MASIQRSVFTWKEIDAASDLDRLRLVLGAIPDEELMQVLEARRGNGRDEYPVRAVWNSVLAGVVFGHPSVAALRRDLSRNGELRDLCGFEPMRGIGAVPPDSAYTHFLEGLLAMEPRIREMFHALVERLRKHLPDLGKLLALDGKALPSFAAPRKKDELVRLAENGQPDRRADPDADWGVKTKRGQHADGTSWEKVSRWFGFELHLLIDSEHELPVNYRMTKASAPETTLLLPIVQETTEKHPEMMANAEELAADKGYDSTANNERLFDDHKIRPIIDKRHDWKAGDTTRPVFGDRVDTVVYDVAGTVSCICPATGEVRPMAPWGYEADRACLKYRCPAVAGDYTCQGRDLCPGAQGAYGKVVRIPLDRDRRMFVPVARGTDTWKRAYARRTAVERVNSRIDRVLGFELHTIRGLAKMEARLGIALVVMLAMALGRIEAGQKDQMRSLLAPALRQAA
jgi:hypothetical protein